MNKQDKYSKVAIAQSSKAWAKELNYEDIRKLVREAVELAGGFKNIIKPGNTVVIKPNLVGSKDGTTNQYLDKELNGITVDWRVAKTVVELVREINSFGKIYILEGSADYKTTDVMKHFNYTKEYIRDVDGFIGLEEDSGGWQDFNSTRLSKVTLPNGLLHKEYYLNRRFKEADVVISLACLKSHASAIITGGIKNLAIGATPANIYGASQTDNSRMYMVPHDNKDGDLHKWIHDYYLCRPADFVILDGLEGFQNGPVPGFVNSCSTDKMNMRLIIAGRDAVAVDTVAALTMNWDPESVAYLRTLSESKAGIIDTARIRVVGKEVDAVRKNFGTMKIPPSGASRIATKIAPIFIVKKFIIGSSEIKVEVVSRDKIHKIEYYLDGNVYLGDLNSIDRHGSFTIHNLASGIHRLKVCAYDRFMNKSEQTIEFRLLKVL